MAYKTTPLSKATSPSKATTSEQSHDDDERRRAGSTFPVSDIRAEGGGLARPAGRDVQADDPSAVGVSSHRAMPPPGGAGAGPTLRRRGHGGGAAEIDAP